MDLLSSIKEEEEKSKLEKINKDSNNKKGINEKINIDNDLLKKEKKVMIELILLHQKLEKILISKIMNLKKIIRV